jgi:hypothetical protein
VSTVYDKILSSRELLFTLKENSPADNRSNKPTRNILPLCFNFVSLLDFVVGSMVLTNVSTAFSSRAFLLYELSDINRNENETFEKYQ